MYIFWDIWRLISSPMLNAPRTRGELLVAEFPGLLVDVALVQVGGKGHGAEVGEQNRRLPRAAIKRLSGIRSWCTIPYQWRYSKASTVSTK